MSTRIRVIPSVLAFRIIVTQNRVIPTARCGMEYATLYVDRIKFLCQKRGYSINKLASISDVKQSTLDNIMRGLTKNPGVKTLHKIALAFNMTLAEFLDFEALNNFSFDDEDDDAI